MWRLINFSQELERPTDNQRKKINNLAKYLARQKTHQQSKGKSFSRNFSPVFAGVPFFFYTFAKSVFRSFCGGLLWSLNFLFSHTDVEKLHILVNSLFVLHHTWFAWNYSLDWVETASTTFWNYVLIFPLYNIIHVRRWKHK